MNQVTISIYIYLLSLMPLIEGRYSIIYATTTGINPLKATLIASLGTFTLSILLPTLVNVVDKIGRGFNESNNFFLRKIGETYVSYLNRLEGRRKLIERYGLLGLMLFVALPLPATGMWTGSLLGLLLGIKGRKLTYPLLLGGLSSNIIICCSLYFGKHLL